MLPQNTTARASNHITQTEDCETIQKQLLQQDCGYRMCAGALAVGGSIKGAMPALKKLYRAVCFYNSPLMQY